MDLVEATKKIKAEKPKENFMLLKFGYDCHFVLPHKDGVAVLNGLASAERLEESYQKPKRITEVSRDQIAVSSMSVQEYERYKIAALLHLSPDEVKEMMEAANKPPSPASATTP